MSGFPPNAQYGWSDHSQQGGFDQSQQGSYNFDMSGSQFGQQQDFQSFETGQEQHGNAYGGYGANPYLDPAGPQVGYSGDIFTPSVGVADVHDSSNFEDEPPLMEELGINPDHIVQKTMAVLNPFRATDAAILQDNDLAGPLVFCLIFGGLLLLSGKVHFSYIYGIGVMGCMAIYALLTLMASTAVTFGNVVSVLGYCLLPMVALSAVNIILSLQGLVGIVLTGLAICWCSLSASKLFVTALAMDHQQPLIAYPCALLYGVFALITIF